MCANNLGKKELPIDRDTRLVFLFDVDNTLLNNDQSKKDMSAALHDVLGDEGEKHFWELYEQVRKEMDVVSYPETLKRFDDSCEDAVVAEKAARVINEWPYGEYLYPESLAVVRHVSRMGEVAIISDGDTDYQPRKIANAGLAEAVGHDVLIFTHKQESLHHVTEILPGCHYIMVDDKESVLADADRVLGDRLTTVWVKQGHYATDPKYYKKPDPDVVLEHIGELCRFDRDDFLSRARVGCA
ncbi:MAG TPA: HAD family hydrolase [Chloroflexia bacterium]|nr:HAD family hydrolase [Chloroflexia bacterium]